MEDLKVLKAILSDAIVGLCDDDKYRGLDLAGERNLLNLVRILETSINRINIVQNDISNQLTFAT